MTDPEPDVAPGADGPAAVRKLSRRNSRDRVDPADARRRRLLLVGTFVAIAALVGAYVVFVAGKPPGGPVRELAVFDAAIDDRDVDTVLALWSETAADATDVREHVTSLFGQIGARGMTPGAEPPRVRKVDATTYRAIHRVGEIELESIWVWDRDRFRLTAVQIAR